jgi:class 3 adenylate cyclase/tetratricopeptide (TPR) repeat protein
MSLAGRVAFNSRRTFDALRATRVGSGRTLKRRTLKDLRSRLDRATVALDSRIWPENRLILWPRTLESNRTAGKQARPMQLLPSSLHATPLEIPDHELIRRVGQGSYGEVWLARNVFGTYRAVKIIERSAFSDARPFEREFGGIKRFEPISRTHPGFVSILHVGRNQALGYFYYIMELADDVSSGQLIQPDTYGPRTLGSDLARRTRLPLTECLQIGLALTAALKHLHKHSLVHRDIKPANIVFINGGPRLADIGLVAAISEAATSLGTSGYAPPEETGSPSADLYSLGKVLYEISTGQGPERFPELPTELNAPSDLDLFARFNELVLRACDNNPQKRFPSAEAMTVALSQCQRTAPGVVPPDLNGPGVARAVAWSGQSERRLLTVLVINISTTVRADPEEARSFMDACLQAIRPVVQRYEGTVAQVLSDGVIASFGGAVACEDHARRGAHAALEIRQALEAQRSELRHKYHFGFELRMGLDTGLAITIRGGLDCLPVGDAVTRASWVTNLGGPGQLSITEETWKAVRDYFVIRSSGQHSSRGHAAEVEVYEVVAAREMRSRIEVGMESGLTPFVGRAKELALLHEGLADARAGRGRIALLAGEPGVGKSRLLLEFKRSVSDNEVCWLAGRSISFGSQMAYLPIIDLLRRLFGIEAADELDSIRARVEAQVQTLGEELQPALPFLKHLLSIEPCEEGVLEMEAQQRRVKTFEALRNLVLRNAQLRPVILVIEDLHWIDRTSEDFLVSLADSLSMAPVLMLLSYRPGYRVPFPERSFIARLTLQPLSAEESLAVARQTLTVTTLPDEVRKLVIAKAEGNPFFVEEMIKSLVEAGALQSLPGIDPASNTVSSLQVPDTIQDVIMSRIDRLEDAPRKALQLASVIGREFAVNLLETIADLSEPLAESLQKLKNLELIYERSVFPEYTCFFKHALTQEVAYNSLLLQRRKELHCLVAAAIEELHANRLPEFYGLLAYHYERGEEWERALEYLRRAAERCRGVGAHREEAFQLTRAMSIAQRLGQSALATDLRGQRGTAWVRVGLWREARPDLEAALAELPVENAGRRAEVLASLAGAYFWGLDTLGMQRCAVDGHALAEKAGRDDLAAELLAWLGAAQQSLGDLAAATDFFERALARGGGYSSAALAMYPLNLYFHGHLSEAVERARESALTCQSLSDMFAATFGHPHLGLALAACGRYSEAARVFEEAKQLGLKHEVWTFLARAVAMSAGFHLELFDFQGNELLAEEARERARSAGFNPSLVSANIDLVFNFARRGEIARAQRLEEETTTVAAQIGGWHQWLWALRLKQARAELAYARGDWSEALRWAEDAISASRARGRRKYVAVGLETRGKALVSLGRKTEAIADLRNALQMARLMGDPALLLRAATTLLATEGDDALLSEARATARKILAELPTEEMRRHFEAAEPVRLLGPNIRPGVPPPAGLPGALGTLNDYEIKTTS